MRKFVSTIAISIILISSISFQNYSKAFANEVMTLDVSSACADAGEFVQIAVSLKNNAGLSSLLFNISCDSVLILQDVEFNSKFGSLVTAAKPYRNPQTVSFISPFGDIVVNDIFAVLTFYVSETVEGAYIAPIKIFCNEDNVFNKDFEKKPIDINNGYVYINSEECKIHNDFDRDNLCDKCGMFIAEINACTCICHKTGVFALVWKIFRIVFKVFNVHNTCYCGEIHY